MSHRDSVGTAPRGVRRRRPRTPPPAVAAMADAARRLYATQFHPEVAHTPARASTSSSTSSTTSPGIPPTWTMVNIIDEAVEQHPRAGGRRARDLRAVGRRGLSRSWPRSLHRAIGDQLTCVFVDHGMLRLDEADQVVHVFRDQFRVHLVHVDARGPLPRAAGRRDRPRAEAPHHRRGVLEGLLRGGDERSRACAFLAQGTLYPDVIESGPGRRPRSRATTTSSRSPRACTSTSSSRSRRCSRTRCARSAPSSACPDEIVHRQPFPGPGLAVRIIGEITREKLDMLRRADAIVREEIGAWDEEREVWQYFAVLPDIRSVGVMGDERTYGRPIIIRAVASADAMTADWARLPHELLAQHEQPHHQRGRRASTGSPTTSRASRPVPSSGSRKPTRRPRDAIESRRTR